MVTISVEMFPSCSCDRYALIFVPCRAFVVCARASITGAEGKGWGTGKAVTKLYHLFGGESHGGGSHVSSDIRDCNVRTRLLMISLVVDDVSHRKSARYKMSAGWIR